MIWIVATAFLASIVQCSWPMVNAAFETIRLKAIQDGRPLKVFQTDNGKEFVNNQMTR
jgi:hypothetical protein